MYVLIINVFISISQAKRQKGQVSGRKNECPHVMSRGGYAKAKQELLMAKQKEIEEAAQDDPSVLLTPPSPIRREKLWVYARQKKSGSYTTDQSRMIAEKVVSISCYIIHLVFNSCSLFIYVCFYCLTG